MRQIVLKKLKIFIRVPKDVSENNIFSKIEYDLYAINREIKEGKAE
jgi:hypothetical protein